MPTNDDAEDDPPDEQVTAAGAVIPVPDKADVMRDLGKVVKRYDYTNSGRVSRIEVLRDWLAAHRDDLTACTAMQTWVEMLFRGRAEEWAHGQLERTDEPGHPILYYAAVPNTGALVTFYERPTVPVRLIVIASIIDAG